MDNRDEALRELQETFRQEREERDLEAMKESSADGCHFPAAVPSRG